MRPCLGRVVSNPPPLLTVLLILKIPFDPHWDNNEGAERERLGVQTGGLDTVSCRVLGILSKRDRGALSQVAPQGRSQHEQRCREAREQVCGDE